MLSQSNFRHPKVKDLQAIEYFLTLLAHQQNEAENQNLQNAITTAQSVLVELGIHERDYKPSIRSILRELKKHFLSISSLTCDYSNNPETWFYNAIPLVSSSLPLGYCIEAGNSVIDGITRKEMLKAELQSSVQNVTSKCTDLKKVKREALAVLIKEKEKAEKRADLLLPEHCETLAYTSDFYRTKLVDLKESKPNKLESVSNQKKKINELLQRFEYLKDENLKMYSKLNELSEDGKLPPAIPQVLLVIAERKNYLDSLNHQISRFNESGSESVFNT